MGLIHRLIFPYWLQSRNLDPPHGLFALLGWLLCPESTLDAREAPSVAACCSHDAPTDSLCSAVGWRYQYAARLSALAKGPSTVTACPLFAPTLHTQAQVMLPAALKKEHALPCSCT